MKIKNILSSIFVGIILVAGVYTTVFYRTAINFIVNGTSMQPTIMDDEIGYASTIFTKKSIKRFDVVIVERETSTEDRTILKRVIGLPNETIEYKDGKLYVNDKYVKETFLSNDANLCTCNPNYIDINSPCIKKITLKEDEYFIMGDNRSVSFDSRAYGPIKYDQIKGKAIYISEPVDGTKVRIIK